MLCVSFNWLHLPLRSVIVVSSLRLTSCRNPSLASLFALIVSTQLSYPTAALSILAFELARPVVTSSRWISALAICARNAYSFYRLVVALSAIRLLIVSKILIGLVTPVAGSVACSLLKYTISSLSILSA